MAFVYWIHLPEHTDMFTEGYIGVTALSVEERYSQHCKAKHSKRDGKTILYNALRKHENVVVDTLVQCSEDYAYFLEERIRPDGRIGWNTAPGGRASGKASGYKLSDETRRKMSKARLGKKLPKEWCENISKAHKGKTCKKPSKEVLLKREHSRFYSNMKKYSHIWRHAAHAYSLYEKGYSPWFASLEILGEKTQGFARMFDHFKNNWKPAEDEDWLTIFAGGNNGS